MPIIHRTNFAYSISQSYEQHHVLIVLHSYILVQLVFPAPREWVHLCLAHGIDCLPSTWWGYVYPSAHSPAWHSSWAWLALVSVITRPLQLFP